jgi:hypothetical protein
MQQKYFHILLFFLINSGINKIDAQNAISFSYNDGTQNSYALQDVRKLDFSDNNLNLHLIDGSVFTWNVNTIGYYDYDAGTPLNIDNILQIANDWSVHIFPNPSEGKQTLLLKLPRAIELSYTLIDNQGKIIVQKTLGTLSKGEHSIPVEWSQAATGAYSIVISSGDFSITKKLIKK